MSLFDIHLHLDNLVKLYEKGRIVKVYDKMNKEAEMLAVHEIETFLVELKHKLASKEIEGMNVINLLIDFRKERIDYHMSEMKKLLNEQLKHKNDENTGKLKNV